MSREQPTDEHAQPREPRGEDARDIGVDMGRNDDRHGDGQREAPERDTIYAPSGALERDFVDEVRADIERADSEALRELIEPLHESETGDVLEALDEDERNRFVSLLGDEFDFTTLREVDDAVREQIVEALDPAQIAEGLHDIDSDDAVFILEDLEEDEQAEILSKLSFAERIRLRRALDYPEESAGRRMQTEFVAVPPFWSVGQTIDYLREDDRLPEEFNQLFVIDPSFRLLGTVRLDLILRRQRTTPIEEMIEDAAHPIPATMDQEEAARIIEQYDLLSAPVVDENGRLVGVLTIDDVVDVIREEAEEDILRLAGVGDEELSDSVMATARSRFVWLLINLGTAVVASLIIGLFDATIQEMVALAVLMPIVASMGGNAATQTMTVAVRALATREIDIYNARRIITRETAVGLLNGIVFAIVTGALAWAWFASPGLGAVIAMAMVINMVSAALAGIFVPLVLDRLGADPAIASSVFVTTVTDVVGFFAFLGLAGWWFGL